jgi:hypothetical protein
MDAQTSVTVIAPPARVVCSMAERPCSADRAPGEAGPVRLLLGGETHRPIELASAGRICHPSLLRDGFAIRPASQFAGAFSAAFYRDCGLFLFHQPDFPVALVLIRPGRFHFSGRGAREGRETVGGRHAESWSPPAPIPSSSVPLSLAQRAVPCRGPDPPPTRRRARPFVPPRGVWPAAPRREHRPVQGRAATAGATWAGGIWPWRPSPRG